MGQEPSTEQSQEKAKPYLLIVKALARIQALYQTLTWENLKAAVNASISNGVKLFGIATGILVVGLVVKDLSADLVMIDPISVPKTLSENGYTPEVASRRLRDALSEYAIKANTSMQRLSIAPRDELLKIVVPKIDLSLDTIVASIRSLLHYGSRRTISGEMIVRDKLAWLRLRIDGQEVFSSPNGYDLENPDELFVAAVPATIDKIRPYLVASTLYDSDPKQAAQKADEIIARLPASDVNVHWSYVLKGNFLSEQGDHVQAEKAYRKAISLNEKNNVAHVNLGNTLVDQGKIDEASVEFRRAIEIEWGDSSAHSGLGYVLGAQGNTEEALVELRLAVTLDPKNASAHNNLGTVLSDQDKPDEAIAEYRLAITLDSKHAPAHNNLGVVLYQQDKLDEAIAEYRLAIETDSKSPLTHTNLGNALRKQGKLDEAIGKYRDAIKIDPNDMRASYQLESALQEQNPKPE